jgi:hypothetical protein
MKFTEVINPDQLESLKVIFLLNEFCWWLFENKPEYGITSEFVSKTSIYYVPEKKFIKSILDRHLESYKFIHVDKTELKRIEHIISFGYSLQFSPIVFDLFLFEMYIGSGIIRRKLKFNLESKIIPWWAEVTEYAWVDQSGYDNLGKPGYFQNNIALFFDYNDYDKWKDNLNGLFQKYCRDIESMSATMIRQVMGLYQEKKQ